MELIVTFISWKQYYFLQIELDFVVEDFEQNQEKIQQSWNMDIQKGY